jgi:hypothetical protein
VRRLVAAFVAVTVMAATMVVGPPTTTGGGPLTTAAGPASASAQVPGAPTWCGPWQLGWYVSPSYWWYFWVWRWCYNPSIQGGYYIDWYSWNWGGFAGPGHPPGYQYSVPES